MNKAIIYIKRIQELEYTLSQPLSSKDRLSNELKLKSARKSLAIVGRAIFNY